MFKNRQPHVTLQLCCTVLFACTLAACSTAAGNGAKRTEHHYVFGKPPTSSSSTVAPVTVDPLLAQKGPADLTHIVYFDFDSYTVRRNDIPILEGHVRWLRNHPGQSLTLQGHTDVRGGTEYNLALGQKRAEAVRRNLQTLGADPSRIEAVSYGKERPVTPGTSEADHQRNRRVEFEYH